ncbi:kinetochore-associated protein KNL-2 homolog [Brassica rapa]|uniref:kinetochore-associated protein KNL-2 homolog n=1 Tax=Brassica campestris TaxID=3711 RepID=UPI000872732B|nr:kinetochore-associated protein KNL-2 homolog [Brassica rapa]
MKKSRAEVFFFIPTVLKALTLPQSIEKVLSLSAPPPSMADNPNPNPDEEDVSYYEKTVVLRDWWLIKCPIESQGKRFGVAGTQIAQTGAVRVFTSSPILKAFDVFTLEASDGVCIVLRGFLNKPRLVQSGFLPQICSEFILGFPPYWESKCNLSFVGLPSGSASINKASGTILSPCNDKKRNLEDIPAQRRVVKTTVTANKKQNTVEISDKPSRKKSLRLQSKSVELMSKVQTTSSTNDGLDKSAKCSDDVEKTDESEVTNNQVDGCGKKHVNHQSGTKVERKLDVIELQKNPTTNDGVERDEPMDNKEISSPSPVDGCGTNTKKITSKNATLTSEERNGKLKVTKTSLKNGKKSEKILQGDLDDVVVEPMTTTHSRSSKVKHNLSVGKTIRKIDFDQEVTPEKDATKHNKTNSMSADSLGQKRSRSGRVLVSPLEYWRNQLPVYDKDRNLIQVNEGRQTNTTSSKGKGGSVSRKPRR